MFESISARQGSDRLDKSLPNGRKRGVDIDRSDVEIGNKETTFGIESVD